MEHLTIEEAKTVVLDYVKERSYNYALLVDGEWGCGKTYFIKQVVIPEIAKIDITPNMNSEPITGKKHQEKENKIKVLYLSLYGINSIDDIAERILESQIESKFKSKGKLLPGIKVTAELIETVFDRTGVFKKSEETLLHLFSDWNNYVLVFDDLERAHIHINLIFGYINQFVEQYEAKVIVIANQSEIYSTLMQNNLEQKYIVCSTASIKFPDIKDQSKSVITLKEMNNRLEYVFGESDQYKKIKEKLIGRTIYFKPDLRKTIEQITLQSITNESVKKEVIKAIPAIVGIMQAKAHFNLRTYQFTLHFLERILLLNEKTGSKMLSEQFVNTLINSILNVSIAFKNGEKNFNWTYEAEYGRININSQKLLGDWITSFRFVHDYVYFSAYDENRIVEVMKEYFRQLEQDSTHEDSAFNKLQGYWVLEDEIIIQLLESLKQEVLINDEYFIERYSLILSELYNLRRIGFEIDIDFYVTSMIKTIENHGNFPQSRFQPDLKEDDWYFCEFHDNMVRLYGAGNQTITEVRKENINKTLDVENGWGNGLYTYCLENKAELYTSGKFLALVDLDLLLQRIKTGSTQDLDDFRLCLMVLYKNADFVDRYQDEEKNLQILFDEIGKMRFESRTKELIREWLINVANKVLEAIRYQRGETT